MALPAGRLNRTWLAAVADPTSICPEPSAPAAVASRMPACTSAPPVKAFAPLESASVAVPALTSRMLPVMRQELVTFAAGVTVSVRSSAPPLTYSFALSSAVSERSPVCARSTVAPRQIMTAKAAAQRDMHVFMVKVYHIPSPVRKGN